MDDDPTSTTPVPRVIVLVVVFLILVWGVSAALSAPWAGLIEVSIGTVCPVLGSRMFMSRPSADVLNPVAGRRQRSRSPPPVSARFDSDADLLSTVSGDLAIPFGRSRHGGPPVLHDEVAPVPGRGCLDRRRAFGELRIALRLVDADQRQG